VTGVQTCALPISPVRIIIALLAFGGIVAAVIVSKRRSAVIGDDPGTPAPPPPPAPLGEPTPVAADDTATRQFERRT